MAKRYMCTNPDHPKNKHSEFYDAMTQEGFCPDCHFGDGLLIEMDGNGGGVEPGYYHVIVKHSGKCLDVADYSQDNCANVFQYTLHGGENQQWFFVKTPDDYYYIFVKHSGKCLDVDGYKQDDCANVWQHAFHGGDNQKWELRDAGDGNYHIIAKHSGKALDVADYSQNDAANVFQYPLHGGDNQKWKLVPISQNRS